MVGGILQFSMLLLLLYQRNKLNYSNKKPSAEAGGFLLEQMPVMLIRFIKINLVFTYCNYIKLS